MDDSVKKELANEHNQHPGTSHASSVEIKEEKNGLNVGGVILKRKRKPDGSAPKPRAKKLHVPDEEDIKLAERIKDLNEIIKAPQTPHVFLGADQGLSRAQTLARNITRLCTETDQQILELADSIDTYISACNENPKPAEKPHVKEPKRMAAEALEKKCRESERKNKRTRKELKTLKSANESLVEKYKALLEKFFSMPALFCDHIGRQLRGNPNLMTTPLSISPFEYNPETTGS